MPAFSQSPPEALICDLDGVVYRGDQACPGAVEGIRQARELGISVLFMTNNAGHTGQAVVDKLAAIGVEATTAEVLTSSAVAAAYLAEADVVGEGQTVLALGGPGVEAALAEQGLACMTSQAMAQLNAQSADEGSEPPVVAAVVQGFGRDVAVQDLTEAAYVLHKGALWVATNMDATMPTDRGMAPGNGSLVAALTHATGRQPDVVVGKPEPRGYIRALDVLGLEPSRVLAVGDRLDTDIAGARRANIPSVLVLTGVHNAQDAQQAAGDSQPDEVVDDLCALVSRWR